MNTRKRAIFKALTWRIGGSSATALAAWALTGRIDVAASLGAIDWSVKLAAYYVHERVWERIGAARLGQQEV